jgi:hypothetical protein
MVQRAASNRAHGRGLAVAVASRAGRAAAPPLTPRRPAVEGSVFFASTVMETTTLCRKARQLLVHTIAALWLAIELTHQAGFACGSVVHRLNQWLAAKAARPAQPADPQRQAVISAWEEAMAAGQWQEPEPVEPLCPGSWWDLIDPGEAAEADPDLPLRWAV